MAWLNRDGVLDDRPLSSCYHPVCVGRQIFQAKRIAQMRATAARGIVEDRPAIGQTTQEHTQSSQLSGR